MAAHLNTPASFWARVKRGADHDCWLWQGSVRNDGYGQIQYQHRQDGAHRIAYMLTHGRIPDGLCVLHHCDTPRCCNPSHLWLGTVRDNAQDMVQKGRKAPTHGSLNAQWKRTPALVEHVKTLYHSGGTYRSVRRQTGLCFETIHKCLHAEP